MADLSVAVEYDRVYPVALRNPVNGEEIGVTINVVSTDSRKVVAALRKAQSEYWSEYAKAKDGEKPELPDSERIVLVNCIDSWDWGDQSFGHISGAGAASLADCEYLIDHPNSKWIRDQIGAKTADLENFTQGSPKTARRGSKKT